MILSRFTYALGDLTYDGGHFPAGRTLDFRSRAARWRDPADRYQKKAEAGLRHGAAGVH